MGGPTETTIWNIVHKVQKDDLLNKFIPYGKPFPNTKYYILDEALEPVPLMVKGVMYVEGIGVSDGYVGNREETLKRFIIHSGIRIYNTGDYGRYLETGEIQILGRVDSQVKINGKRIELNGIEHRLNQIDGILECCVVVHIRTKKLAAFYTSSHNLKPDYVKEYLSKQLATYMIPQVVEKLDVMPLNHNGKPDRKKLGKWELSIRDQPDNPVLPELEGRLLEICQRVLENPSVQPDDNFYLMGGDSISAMKLVSEIYRTFHIDLEVYDIMNQPYIADWAEIIKKNQLEQNEKAENLTEQLLAICKTVLHNNEIRESDDFYSMGGDEHSVMELIDKIMQFTNSRLSEFLILSKPYISNWVEELIS